MTYQLHPKLIDFSFARLRPICSEGKKSLERTSGLFYFLAFDACSKLKGQDLLDFDPNNDIGKNNRDAITVEFVKLSQLSKSTTGEIRHVSELGSVKIGGKDPAKRISSNFLTIPLKKASMSQEPDGYPKRPSAPLVNMGPVATGRKWGIQKHLGWQQNLPLFMTDLKTNTPFVDLAIFVCRNELFPALPDNLIAALSSVLGKKFSKDLAEWWNLRIRSERRLFPQTEDVFTNKTHRPLDGFMQNLKQPQTEDYSARVAYLERLLDQAGIQY